MNTITDPATVVILGRQVLPVSIVLAHAIVALNGEITSQHDVTITVKFPSPELALVFQAVCGGIGFETGDIVRFGDQFAVSAMAGLS